MVTIQKVGDSPNVQYKEYICDSVEDLAAIQAPVVGSIAYIYENGKVNKYIYINGAWVQ